MTQEHPSKLSFSIEESVWLNKGQEVKEVLSMSLEPEITIEEHNQHVYIKGGLRLVGEYVAVSRADSELDPEQPLEEQISYRSVEEFQLTEEGQGEIKHFFPIDVTIPISRIQNLDDVFVEVESFDYDLPEKSCIQLTADVGISGMATHQEEEVREEDEELEIEPEAISENSLEDTSFSFEARKVEEKEMPDPISPPVFEKEEAQVEEEEEEEEEAPVAKKIEPELKPVEERKPLEYLYKEKNTPVANKEEQPVQEVSQEPDAQNNPSFQKEQSTPEEPVVQIKPIEEEALVVEVEPELEYARSSPAAIIEEEELVEDVHVEEECEVEVEEKTRKEENALYLTKMLTKGEERFSKWKMCIIQENESLDSIAERYDIPTSTLIRFNRLKEEQVEEGQILYIPVSNQP
ncbi:stage VI sporulation protein D [Alkalihalobacillus sp. 1P02AB]|uniref:stage VI sporulation protein D n=1 Tax=Alkalihalobacillus sp. 1P02AB TaxID=3132260 RepID=UPI0039A694F8